VPAFTFWVDVAVVELAGLKPVFVDVELETLNIDTAGIDAVVTPKTKCILLAHLNGLPADMEPLMEIAQKHGLRVIEDCARTCGGRYQDRRVGSFDIGAFSFGYGKSFYGFGGGMITSNDTELIDRLRRLQKDFTTLPAKRLYKTVLKGCLLKYLDTPSIHGFTLFPLVYRYHMKKDKPFASWFRIQKPDLKEVPAEFKNRMDDIQAKMGFRQIKTIDQTNAVRRGHLDFLNRELEDTQGLRIPIVPSGRDHVNVHYAIWTKQKKALQDFLMDNRIDAQDESAEDVTRMTRFKKYVNRDFPNARRLHNRLIYIPSHPCLNKDDLQYIAAKIKQFFMNRHNANATKRSRK